MVLLGLYLFYVIDITYSGFIPLFAYSSGQADYGGSINYGIPLVHVIAVTFNLFYCLYVFHQYLSSRKKSLLFIYFLLIIPFIFLLQRSNIMYIILGSFLIYVLSVANVLIGRMVHILIAVIFTLFLFGYLGNLRSANGDSTFIPRSSGVTDEFLKGPVPNEFYWSYLYIGSPLANLQNNINQSRYKYYDYSGLVVNELMPDFISKRVSTELSITPRVFEQINPFLNVGTIYSRPYNYAGWGGMSLVFVFFIIIMNIYCLVVSRSYQYGMTGIAMMFVAIALANFENTISFSAYSFQLIYPLLLSARRKYKQAKKEEALKWRIHSIVKGTVL